MSKGTGSGDGHRLPSKLGRAVDADVLQMAMRISVSSWRTRIAEATFAADVILDSAARIR